MLEPISIPSKQFLLWQRLYARFLLEPSPSLGPTAGVSSLVIPTTDADRLLRRQEIERHITTITGTGPFIMFTVPNGERWTISYFNLERLGGTWDHDRIDILEPAGTAIIIDSYTAITGLRLVTFSPHLELDEGWQCRIDVATHSVNGDARLAVLRHVEDAF